MRPRRSRARRARAPATPCGRARRGGSSCQELPSGRADRLEARVAGVAAVTRRDPDAQVALGEEAGRLLGPLDDLQARIGEHLAKARVFPFLRIVEAIEVAVRDLEA